MDEDGIESGEDSKSLHLFRACLVEFVGNVLFILIGSLSASSSGGVLPVAVAHGFTIFILVASMGHISGGHYNPAVSLGVFISGNLGIVATLLYMISQLSGGFVGSLFFRAVTAANTTTFEDWGGGATLPSPAFNAGSWVVCEFLLTFFLVNTVLNAAVDPANGTPLAPLAIGATVMVDILAGGSISGASMNPARSLGPAIAYSIFGSNDVSRVWTNHWIYWVGPLAGGAVAGLLYHSILAEKSHRWFGRHSGSVQIHPNK